MFLSASLLISQILFAVPPGAASPQGVVAAHVAGEMLLAQGLPGQPTTPPPLFRPRGVPPPDQPAASVPSGSPPGTQDDDARKQPHVQFCTQVCEPAQCPTGQTCAQNCMTKCD